MSTFGDSFVCVRPDGRYWSGPDGWVREVGAALRFGGPGDPWRSAAALAAELSRRFEVLVSVAYVPLAEVAVPQRPEGRLRGQAGRQ